MVFSAIAGLICEYLKWKQPRKAPFDKSTLQSVAPSTSLVTLSSFRVCVCVRALLMRVPADIMKDLSIFADPSVVQSAGAVFQSMHHLRFHAQLLVSLVIMDH